MLKKVGMFVTILVLVLLAVFIGLKNKKIDEVQVDNINISDIKDGNYSGEYSTKLLSVKVEVSVEDNKIKNILISEHKNGLGKKAEKIVDEMVENQTIQVDSVSGATASSNAIKKAVEAALKKGLEIK